MDKRRSELSVTAQLSQQCLDDSLRWFGDTISDPKSLDMLIHHVLSLCGEAGELANLIKKVQRGSLNMRDATTRHNVAMELTDVYIYVLNIAGMLGIDLERAYDQKRMENEKRFIVQRRERAARNGTK